MKLLLAGVTSCVFAVSLSADVVVAGAGQTGVRDCGGGTAVVNGQGADITLKNCANLTINGSGNRVAAGTTAAIAVIGNRNTITWTAGPAGSPSISNIGSGNTVSQASASPAPASPAAPKPPAPAAKPVEPTSSAPASGGGPTLVSVRSSNSTKTYDCNGGTASVAGDDNDLTFKNCISVSVPGDGNKIDVGTAKILSVPGDRNTLTWPAGGAKPIISDKGEGNVFKAR